MTESPEEAPVLDTIESISTISEKNLSQNLLLISNSSVGDDLGYSRVGSGIFIKNLSRPDQFSSTQKKQLHTDFCAAGKFLQNREIKLFSECFD